MTRGQRGKIKLIICTVMAMGYYYNLPVIGILGFCGIGYYLLEAVFGDALERAAARRNPAKKD